MMKIKLKNLTLEYFKGIKHFIFEPGDNCLIKGPNGSGKTTLMDAFLWLLFGKDSQGKADFALKTLKDGQELHDLDHAVEGVFDIDGQVLTLKKALKERYTKKRGNSRADFTGHETQHYIDGVPIQKKEWDQQISSIIDEETFKLLTSPTYFNSLHWEKRRQILLDVCGDILDSDVIASDKALAILPEILGNKSIEDQKKIIAAKRKEINQRLTEIPSRIDELDKSLTDVSGYDIDAIHVEINKFDAQIQAMNDDTQSSLLRKQKAELRATLSELEVEKEKANRDVIKGREENLEPLQKEIRVKRVELIDSDGQLVRIDESIKHNEKRMEELRTQYKEIVEESTKHDFQTTCPTCGQVLPKDQVEKAIQKHNQRQADRLADINTEGKRLKNDNVKLRENFEWITEKNNKIEKELRDLDKKIKEIEGAPLAVPFDMSKIEKVKAEIQEIERQISENIPPNTAPLEEKRRTLQSHIAEVEASKRTRIRIKELAAEEKDLAAEYEELERQIFLMEKFTVAKVDLLEGKINNKFELARFKLFEQQINEGIKDTCITLYDGVPYGYGLNTGMEINVGLDIIKTLSSHYGIKAPVFIDHAESVTDILDPGTQTIKLMVSEDHPTMEVSHG